MFVRVVISSIRSTENFVDDETGLFSVLLHDSFSYFHHFVFSIFESISFRFFVSISTRARSFVDSKETFYDRIRAYAHRSRSPRPRLRAQNAILFHGFYGLRSRSRRFSISRLVFFGRVERNVQLRAKIPKPFRVIQTSIRLRVCYALVRKIFRLFLQTFHYRALYFLVRYVSSRYRFGRFECECLYVEYHYYRYLITRFVFKSIFYDSEFDVCSRDE